MIVVVVWWWCLEHERVLVLLLPVGGNYYAVTDSAHGRIESHVGGWWCRYVRGSGWRLGVRVEQETRIRVEVDGVLGLCVML